MRKSILAAFLTMGLMTSAHAYTMFYLSDSIRWTQAHSHVGDFPKEQIDECNHVVATGATAFDLRDKGKTRSEALAELNASVETARSQGHHLLQATYLELSRMFYTVYRHPKMDLDHFYVQFFSECMSQGSFVYTSP